MCTKYDSKRNSGWHKTHPGKCCRGYRDSVWIDANVSVLTPYLADEIRTRQADILSPIHNHRDCIYDETDIVQEWNLDTVEKCSAMRHLLESSGMPRHYGLNETNIVYRRHRNRVVRKIDTMWWDLILKYSRRDQLSLSYILWRHGIRPTDIATNNTREDRINFYVAQHTKATKSATFLGNSMKYGFWDWVQMRVLCSLIPVKKWRHNARRHIRRKLKGTETKTETETQLIEPLPNPLPPADMTPVVQSVSENQISLRDCPEEKLPQLLRQKFFEYTGKWPSQELETLNEKIIWAQMFNATDLKTKLADKYTVRDYVADKIGDTYLTKLYDVWDDVNQIDFTSLPDKYVLKFSEGSGKVLLVPNKNKLDIEHAKQQIISWQNNPFWLMACEMQYKNSAKKIIAEEFIDTKIEYKLWIFHGKCKFIKIEIMNDFAENGKPDNQFGKFFYPDWTPADFRTIGDEPNFNIPKPNKLDELIKISEILAEPFDFVRVDFFETHKGKLVFGEMTFSPAAGGVHFEPASKNIEFGKLWTLPPRDDNGFAIYEK
ncbi:hypothetical protein HDR63_02215 [bacterium]|nr:hypothetical protein [bacterium]